jgi:hypothetical protein
MEFSWLGSACDVVILIGAVILAFERIIKPIIFVKKKSKNSFEEKVSETLKAVLPDILNAHYEDIKEQLLKDTSAKVEQDIADKLSTIELLQQQYDVLVLTAKDVLREKIMKIYHDYRKSKQLPQSKKEQME